MNRVIAYLVWLWSFLTSAARVFFGRTERTLQLKTRGVQRLYRCAREEDIPDSLGSFTVYFVGEGENLWAAAMTCPCGCSERIELNLLPQVRPRWIATEHDDHTVSLEPSVWRQTGGRSHFILRRGRIIWS